MNAKNDNSTIRFSHTITGVVQFLYYTLLSFIPYGILKISITDISLIAKGLSLLLGAVFFCVGISKVLRKKIVKINGDVFFYNGPIRYKLDSSKIIISYEKVFVFGVNVQDHCGLVLHRDKNKMLGFTMSNKFIMRYAVHKAILEYYQEEFQKKIGVEINIMKPFW